MAPRGPALEPAGFPNCARCPLLNQGSPSVCSACARKTLPKVSTTACPVCSQATVAGRCGNRLCSDRDRVIERIDAIAMYTDPLSVQIQRYKYQHKSGWATIFARILLGHLDDYLFSNSPSGHFDVLVANPTHPSRKVRHTELVLERAAAENIFDYWPIDVEDPRLLIKERITPQSARGDYDAKRAAAEEAAAAITITDSARIEGQRVMLFDDIATTGLQLNAIARRLLDAGAHSVVALVLARTPWTPRPVDGLR